MNQCPLVYHLQGSGLIAFQINQEGIGVLSGRTRNHMLFKSVSHKNSHLQRIEANLQELGWVSDSQPLPTSRPRDGSHTLGCSSISFDPELFRPVITTVKRVSKPFLFLIGPSRRTRRNQGLQHAASLCLINHHICHSYSVPVTFLHA